MLLQQGPVLIYPSFHHNFTSNQTANTVYLGYEKRKSIESRPSSNFPGLVG
jgi:hypothetical protein